MIRLISVLLTVFAILWLAGCGSEEPIASSEGPATVSFRVAGNAPQGTPWYQQWERFEATIQAADGLEAKMFVTGQLGNPDKALADTRRGRIQVGGFPLAGAAAVIPELNVLLIPYLFESEAEVDYILDEVLLEAYEALFLEKDLVLLQWVDAGWNNLYGKQGFLEPGDVVGNAMRSQPTIASQVFLETLDADTIPMGYAEVLPSLQTGLIDGGESVTPMYLVGGLVAEAPHLTLTRHAYDSGVIVANRGWFEGLTPEQQALVASAIGTQEQVRVEVRQMIGGMVAAAVADGLVVHELDDAARSAWIEATAEQRAILVERIGGQAAEILAAIERGKAAFRAAREG